MNSKIKITVCMGSACFARGNAKNLMFIENYIKENNLNATVELAGSRCNGDCPDGPNIMVNDIKYGAIDEKIIVEIFESITKA